MSLLGAIMQASGGGGGRRGYGAPPNAFHQGLNGMPRNDGADLFRLMSKAARYSQQSSGRKQKKGDQYAYMAGHMMNQHNIRDPSFQQYHQAYQMGGQHGCNQDMLGQFRTGQRTQQRTTRRQRKGRYNSRPQNHNHGQGRKQQSGSMFDFFDSDTSSSSSSDSD